MRACGKAPTARVGTRETLDAAERCPELRATAGGPLKDPRSREASGGSWIREVSGHLAGMVDNSDNNKTTNNSNISCSYFVPSD